MSWYLCCILKIRNLKKPFFLSILCQVVEVQDAKLDTSNAFSVGGHGDVVSNSYLIWIYEQMCVCVLYIEIFIGDNCFFFNVGGHMTVLK